MPLAFMQKFLFIKKSHKKFINMFFESFRHGPKIEICLWLDGSDFTPPLKIGNVLACFIGTEMCLCLYSY